MNISKKGNIWMFTTITLFLCFLIPLAVSAASLSFIGSSNDPETYNVNTSYNSQNIQILDINIDNSFYYGAFGGGDIEIIDGVALVAGSGISGTVLSTNKIANNGKISLYKVREGDTLSQIAEMFDVSTNTIRWANDFSGPIHPGQELIILPITGLTHVVQNGGTIADIADIYEADIQEIALFNGINADHELSPGDEIIVPNVEPVIEESSNSGSYAAGPSPSGSISSSNYYINPVPGAILTQGNHGYNAVDLGIPKGTPAYAAATGRVIDSRQGGWNGGYGIMVIVSHANSLCSPIKHDCLCWAKCLSW